MDQRRRQTSFDFQSHGSLNSVNSSQRPLLDRRRVSSLSSTFYPPPMNQLLPNQIPPQMIPQQQQNQQMGGYQRESYRESRNEDDYYNYMQYYGPILPPQQLHPPIPAYYFGNYSQPAYPNPYNSYAYALQQQMYQQQAPKLEDQITASPLDKDLRVFLAENKRNKRNPMVEFINISVNIQLLQYQFKITVDTTQSIDYLAKLVEADFNFQLEALEGKQVSPLMVRLVLNSQEQPIHFDTLVGDVLNNNDTIIIIHSEKQVEENEEELTHSGMLIALERFRQTQDQDDMTLKKILRSKNGFKYFAEYCYKEYSIEYLLFWLEVEIFVESPPETWLLFARYLHKMYLRKNSPLRLNVRPDIIEDVPVPTYEIVQKDQTFFDETQQDAYNVLKLHLLHGFMKSPNFQQWQEGTILLI
eukprot:NODE_1009_length_2709_cov_0.437931.p1 type:complete len:415 gc:universal NODE_1009_length_2709_cov_0.437931:1309-65(-)